MKKLNFNNIRLIFFLFFIIFLACSGNSDNEVITTTFIKYFGGNLDDIARSVQQTNDDGYIILGSTNSFEIGSYDVYLVKLDFKGNIIWSKTFGGSELEWGFAIQKTGDDGYIISGKTRSYKPDDCPDCYSSVYLIKVDNYGNEQWYNVFSGGTSGGYSVQKTFDGGFIIVGANNSYDEHKSDVYLLKTDQYGNLLWSKKFGGSEGDIGNFVEQTSDSGYLIIGATKSFGDNLRDIYIIKTDDSGNLLWQKTFGGDEWDEGYSGLETNEGDYLIVGGTDSFGPHVIILMKLDDQGNILWYKTLGQVGAGGSSGFSIDKTNDDMYVITGIMKRNVFLMKVDSEGNEIFTKTYVDSGDSNLSVGYDIKQTNDGGNIIVGYTVSDENDDADILVIKTDSNGSIKQ